MAVVILASPVTPKSPWQIGYVERVIGSIRRECLDHIVVFSAAHLRRVLNGYSEYYNAMRTHLRIAKEAPVHSPLEVAGSVVSCPFLGGLHHQYARI